MSAVIEEVSRGFTKDTVRRGYLAHGYANETDARAALLAKLTADGITTIGGLVVQNVAGDEEASEVWRCSVDWGPYEKPTPPQTGESDFSFELSLQPVKVVVPLATTVFGPTLANPPKLIGDQRTIDPPEGCEVYEPFFTFSETHYIPSSTMTLSYRNTLGRLVGKTNNAAFKGWEAGEVLAQSISGSKRGQEDWAVTFRFGCRENVTGATIAGISGVDKKGWEYLWPYYKLADSGTTLLNDVTHIIVNKVFQEANYAGFGIGV